MKLYNKLKGIMAEKNITQQELARKLEMGINTLNFKINGKSDFTVNEAKLVSKFFDKKIEEIFYNDEI